MRQLARLNITLNARSWEAYGREGEGASFAYGVGGMLSCSSNQYLLLQPEKVQGCRITLTFTDMLQRYS